ncbi:hypothetical protein AX16_003957 [Volvariella volvacea WC 439]|nr:hypothetical protein AX16_003957 [Volvariella volvacea WC 439]
MTPFIARFPCFWMRLQSNVLECKLGSWVKLKELNIYRLSEAPDLGVLVFQEAKGGVLELLGGLWIIFRSVTLISRGGVSVILGIARMCSLINPEDSEDVLEDIARLFWDASDGGEGGAVSCWGEGRYLKDGQIEHDADDDYRNLIRDVAYCADCAMLGRSFFAKLQKIMFKIDPHDAENMWWTKHKLQRQLHPVAEFIVRRIRCGLAIEKLKFEASCMDSYWPTKLVDLQKRYDHLCSNYSPSITEDLSSDIELELKPHELEYDSDSVISDEDTL